MSFQSVSICQSQLTCPKLSIAPFPSNHFLFFSCQRIMGSTATFGAPFYGERVWGQLATVSVPGSSDAAFARFSYSDFAEILSND